MSHRIRVLISDDDPGVRVTIRVMLEDAGFEIAGEAADGQEAVERTAELSPDVVLMDMMMPVMDGLEASRRILSRHRGARILALTSLEADEMVLAAVRAGVRGYVHKVAAPAEIAAAVREVHRGELIFPAALTRKFLAGSAASLTRTEAELRTLRQEWPTLRTKLYRPEAPADLVAREDLLARLEAGRRLPLTLVSAPAGYGKSTLVSHWLETRSAATTEAASTWLSLDPADSDQVMFLHYFLAAVRTLFPTACQSTAELLEAVEPPPARFLARSLVNDLAAIEERFVLVLDDYHLIDEPAAGEPAVHELVSHLLRHPPRSLHLVILTRQDPPLPLTSLAAGHRLSELRLEDLRFDQGQSAAFIDQALGRPLSSSSLGQLHGSTEGWPAGLRLAVQALQHGSDPEELTRGFGDDARGIRDYLVAEILSRQPPRVRDCLAKVAIFDRFCAPLCQAVCVPGDRLSGDGDQTPPSAMCFEDLLEGAGLLSIALDGRHEWYRFHHLFRQLLRRQLEAETSAEERATLHLRASTWLAARGLVEEALRHALAGGDVETAVELVSEKVDETMNRQQWHLLERWLKMFPAEVVAAQPLLLLLKALSRFHRFQYSEGWKMFDRAEPLVAALPAASATGHKLRGILEIGRCHRCYMTGDADRAVAHGERALALIPPQAEDLRGFVLGFLGASLWWRGERERAEQVLYDALAEPSPDRGSLHARALTALTCMHYMAGDLGGLERLASTLLKLGEEIDSANTREWASYYLGIVRYQRGELEAAAGHLTVATGRPFQTWAVLRFHAVAALALCRLAAGREDQARELAESFAGQMVESGNAFGLTAARAFLAELALRCGRTAEAIAWVRELPRRGTADPEPILPIGFTYAPQFTLARAWIAEGRGGADCPPAAGRCVGPAVAERSLRRAEEFLDRLADFGARPHHTPCRIEVLALQALLHQARGDQPAALRALTKAIALALPGGFVRIFVDLGPHLAPLLEGLELDQEASRYVGRILAAFRREPDMAARPAAATTRRRSQVDPSAALSEPLTGRELEVLALLVDRLSYKEIATELGVSSGTVKRHVHNIYGKFGVSSRHRLLAKANEMRVPERRPPV